MITAKDTWDMTRIIWLIGQSPYRDRTTLLMVVAAEAQLPVTASISSAKPVRFCFRK